MASRTRSETAVLLADNERFEAGYVGAVLAARGIDLVGPIADLKLALHELETRGFGAAVIAYPDDPEAHRRLAAALKHLGIPYLTLSRVTGARVASPEGAVLAAPFAAYQVADWVMATLAGDQ